MINRAGITAHDNLFCDMLAPRFNTKPSLEVSKTLLALCRCFNFENMTINKHSSGTFENI